MLLPGSLGVVGSRAGVEQLGLGCFPCVVQGYGTSLGSMGQVSVCGWHIVWCSN